MVLTPQQPTRISATPANNAANANATLTNAGAPTQFNIGASYATVKGRGFQPLRQQDPSNYGGNTQTERASLAAKEGPDACYATVVTMIERQTGNPSATINQYYGKSLPNNISVANSVPLSKVPTGSDLMIISGTTHYIDPNTKQLARNPDGSYATEPHYLLGTDVIDAGSGKKYIVANDPFSGDQLKIDSSTGKAVDPPANYKTSSFTADSYEQVQILQAKN